MSLPAARLLDGDGGPPIPPAFPRRPKRRLKITAAIDFKWTDTNRRRYWPKGRRRAEGGSRKPAK